jgi:demethylmenaquinone methyltransferase/2-methoxy-6-polyprenyl-1,4-benzoquinol methylase
MPTMANAEGTRGTYQRIARVYDAIELPFEYGRYRSIRPLLFTGLQGRILEAGIGTGRNMPFYPSPAEVVGVDQSPSMLKRAAGRIGSTRAHVHLLEMDVTKLAFPDGYFDAAVASFLLCTMPAAARVTALRELARAVKPKGPVRLLEYAPAQRPIQRLTARIWQPWVSWAFGARLDEYIEDDLETAGLNVLNSRYVTGSIKLIEAAMPNLSASTGKV